MSNAKNATVKINSNNVIECLVETHASDIWCAIGEAGTCNEQYVLDSRVINVEEVRYAIEWLNEENNSRLVVTDEQCAEIVKQFTLML